MAIRNRYSSLDMIRMAKFAKENTELRPMELIKVYNEKHPETTIEQRNNNIRNWIGNNCKCEKPKYNYPEMVWCDECKLIIED